MNIKTLFKNNLRICIILYFAFLLLHLWFATANSMAVIYADEGYYIQNARQFVFELMGGVIPNSARLVSQFFRGSSYLMAPAFFLNQNVDAAYNYVQIINSMFMAFIPVLGFLTIRVASPSEKVDTDVLITCCVSLIAPLLVYSNLALSEASFITIYMLIVFLLVKLAHQPTRWSLWACLAICSILEMMIHGRGFGIFFSILVTLYVNILPTLTADWTEKRKRQIFLSALSLSVVMIAAIISYINTQEITGISWKYFSGILANDSLDKIQNFIVSIFGTYWYLMILSVGLLQIGLYKIPEILRSKNSAYKTLGTFSLLSLVSTLALTKIGDFKTSQEIVTTRGDYLLYGRYVEGILFPFVFLALRDVFLQKLPLKKLFLLLISSCAVIYITLFLLPSYSITDLPIYWAQVQGLAPFRVLFPDSQFSIATVSLSVLSFATIAYIVSLRSRAAFLALVTAYFFLSSFASSEINIRVVNDTYVRVYRNIVFPMRYFFSVSDDRVIGHDERLDQWDMSMYRLFAPPDVTLLHDNHGLYKIMISPDKSVLGEQARLIGKSSPEGEYLWLKPGPELDKFIQQGYVLPPNFPAALETSAMQYVLQAEEVNSRYCNIPDDTCLKVTYSHTGEKNFWPASYAFENSEFGVYIEATIKRNNAPSTPTVIDLWRNVYPGQTDAIYYSFAPPIANECVTVDFVPSQRSVGNFTTAPKSKPDWQSAACSSK